MPGLASRAAMYRPAVPPGWNVLELPSFRRTGGVLARYVEWLRGEIDAREGQFVLAGHSMGGALATIAAAESPDRFARLVLISPAGFPVAQSIPAGLLSLGTEVLRGRFRFVDVVAAGVRLGRAPRAAGRLARELRELDLSPQMEAIRAAGVRTVVVGCSTDALITPDHCRRAARLLGGEYQEVEHDAGHMWMLADPPASVVALEATLAP